MRTPICAAILVLLCALSLRVLAAARTDALWRDEANDLFVVRESASVSELFSHLRAEGSPPLAFLVEYAIQRQFPNAVSATRAAVVLFGSAAVGLVIAIGWRAFGPWAGILAGLLAATSPFLIRFSVDLRAYGQFQLAAAAYGLAMVALMDRVTVRRALVSGLAGGFLMLTHYYGVFMVFSATTFAAFIYWRRANRQAAVTVGVSAAIALVAFLWWAPTFFIQATSDLRPWATASRKGLDLIRVLDLPFGGFSRWPVIVLLAIGLFALLTRSRMATTRAEHAAVDRESDLWGLLVAGAVGANVLAWLVQFIEPLRARLEPWYLVGMALWLLPVVGMGLAQTARRHWMATSPTTTLIARGGWAVGLVLLGLLGLGQALAVHTWLRPRSPAPLIASTIEQNSRAGDLIVIMPAPHASVFNFYYAGPLEEWAPPFRRRITNMPWFGLVDLMEDRDSTGRFMRDVEEVLHDKRRVWFINGSGRLPDRAALSIEDLEEARTRYERAIRVIRRDLLQVLYRQATPSRPLAIPDVDYWEPMDLVLFEPI